MAAAHEPKLVASPLCLGLWRSLLANWAHTALHPDTVTELAT